MELRSDGTDSPQFCLGIRNHSVTLALEEVGPASGPRRPVTRMARHLVPAIHLAYRIAGSN